MPRHFSRAPNANAIFPEPGSAQEYQTANKTMSAENVEELQAIASKLNVNDLEYYAQRLSTRMSLAAEEENIQAAHEAEIKALIAQRKENIIKNLEALKNKNLHGLIERLKFLQAAKEYIFPSHLQDHPAAKKSNAIFHDTLQQSIIQTLATINNLDVASLTVAEQLSRLMLNAFFGKYQSEDLERIWLQNPKLSEQEIFTTLQGLRHSSNLPVKQLLLFLVDLADKAESQGDSQLAKNLYLHTLGQFSSELGTLPLVWQRVDTRSCPCPYCPEESSLMQVRDPGNRNIIRDKELQSLFAGIALTAFNYSGGKPIVWAGNQISAEELILKIRICTNDQLSQELLGIAALNALRKDEKYSYRAETNTQNANSPAKTMFGTLDFYSSCMLYQWLKCDEDYSPIFEHDFKTNLIKSLLNFTQAEPQLALKFISNVNISEFINKSFSQENMRQLVDFILKAGVPSEDIMQFYAFPLLSHQDHVQFREQLSTDNSNVMPSNLVYFYLKLFEQDFNTLKPALEERTSLLEKLDAKTLEYIFEKIPVRNKPAREYIEGLLMHKQNSARQTW